MWRISNHSPRKQYLKAFIWMPWIFMRLFLWAYKLNWPKGYRLMSLENASCGKDVLGKIGRFPGRWNKRRFIDSTIQTGRICHFYIKGRELFSAVVNKTTRFQRLLTNTAQTGSILIGDCSRPSLNWFDSTVRFSARKVPYRNGRTTDPASERLCLRRSNGL